MPGSYILQLNLVSAMLYTSNSACIQEEISEICRYFTATRGFLLESTSNFTGPDKNYFQILFLSIAGDFRKG